MILIISVNQDWSTNDVIEWIEQYGGNWFRLNIDDIDKYSISLFLDQVPYFTIADREGRLLVSSKEINAVWYRRVSNYPVDINFPDKYLKDVIQAQIGKEFKYFLSGFFQILENKYWLNQYSTATNDKIRTLIEAKKCGLKTPDTIISSQKSELRAFVDKHKEVILKPIYNVDSMEFDDGHYMPYAKVIDESMLEQFDTCFFPSLFQKKISKQYEIRTFFLEDSYYSMAILSQADEQTQIDFRKYNYVKPNRTPVGASVTLVPFYQ